MSACLDADWPAPWGVRALTTLRHGLGVSQAPFDAFNLGLRCGDSMEHARENRRLLSRALALPSQPRWLQQVHGSGVVRFGNDEGASEAAEPVADAAVTSVPGVVLVILTADCLPVVFAADDGLEIGAAHAGWRGLAGGVLEATVSAMHTPPARLRAWLGPCAGPHAYEIGEDVRTAFVQQDAQAEAAFMPTRQGHWRIDLYALARKRLMDAGVGLVHGGGHCTIRESDRFFSHRRATLEGDGRTGRMATLVWMER